MSVSGFATHMSQELLTRPQGETPRKNPMEAKPFESIFNEAVSYAQTLAALHAKTHKQWLDEISRQVHIRLNNKRVPYTFYLSGAEITCTPAPRFASAQTQTGPVTFVYRVDLRCGECVFPAMWRCMLYQPTYSALVHVSESIVEHLCRELDEAHAQIGRLADTVASTDPDAIATTAALYAFLLAPQGEKT